MNGSWETKKLENIAYLAGRIGWKGLTAKEYTKEGPLFISVHSLNYGDYVDYRDAFHISQARYDESPEIMLKKDDILICKDGAGIGKLGIIGELPAPATINSSLLLIRPLESALPKYLYYIFSSPFFQRIVQERIDGATTPHLYQREIKQFPVFISSLSEQERIVTILDEAFAGISQAIANAEKNLANARELFESYLNDVFAKKGEEWHVQALGDVCELIGGGTPSKKNENFYKGEIPWATVRDMKQDVIIQTEFKINNDAIKNSSTNIIKAGNVVIATRVGLGKVCLISQDTAINQDLRGIVPMTKDVLTVSFLFWWLKSIAHLIEGEGTGATVQGVKLPFVKSLRIPFPSIHKQKQISNQIDDLRTKTQCLETIYQQKLTALVELKQSILQKAFAGELTVGVETTLPEFTAKVLAFAYHRHASWQRDKTFGRVKAQKILHLAESIGGVDLGRNPIKDAAGPNDFKHMLNAEKWAEANQFFKFVKRDKGYDFKKLGRYNEMIKEALSTIQPYRKELEKVVDLLIPMNSEEAEVLATVHAAWNELILDGKEFDDNKIILEARDNWHPDKMSISEARFRKAIRLIRDKGLAPDGTAKRVSGQGRLL